MNVSRKKCENPVILSIPLSNTTGFSMSYSTLSVTVEKGEELVVSTRPVIDPKDDDTNTHQYQLPFRVVGDSRELKGTEKGFPFIKTLLSLSAPEQWFFSLIYENMDYRNNISIVISKSFSRTEVNKISSAYKLLNRKNLVKRVSPNKYMVNPDALIYSKNYLQNKNLWEQL